MGLIFADGLSLVATHSSTSHRRNCRDSFLARQELHKKYHNHKDILQSELL